MELLCKRSGDEKFSSAVLAPVAGLPTVKDKDNKKDIRINCWHKNMDAVVIHLVSKLFGNCPQQSTNGDCSLEFDSIDIVLGGDHGQGSFRAPARMNFQTWKKESEGD